MAEQKARFKPVTVLHIVVSLIPMLIGVPAGASDVTASNSRGYPTTPQELTSIAQKAGRGIEPYQSAVQAVIRTAGEPSAWSYGTIGGQQDAAGRTMRPPYLGFGSAVVFAKAMVYHLTGKGDYAATVRTLLLDLTDTGGYGGDVYSGGNQNILNLSWYVPGFIMAADLIEDYPGWRPEDKRSFQTWLAREIYKKTDWASDMRSNNWGSAGSATAAMIADYLTGSGLTLIDRNGKEISPAQAYAEAKQRQLDRMNGNTYMDNYSCHQAVGIRPDGGIPEELVRGSTGCDGLWLKEMDGSYGYMMTHLQGTVLHAELLLRRGDASIYENKTENGAGSILRAIHFVINNPNDQSKSFPWEEKQALEPAYRYYRDPYMAQQLGFGTANRYIGGRSNQMFHFGTITHGFAADEDPGPPPTVPPPG